MRNRSIIILFFLANAACSRRPSTVPIKPLPAPVTITMGGISEEIFRDTEFGIHLINRDSCNVLTWLDREKNIRFQALTGDRTYNKLPFRHVAAIPQNYNVRICGDTLFFLDFNNKVFVVTQMADDTVKVLQAYDLAPQLKSKNCIIAYQTWNTFEIRFPFLYLALASENRASNFIYPAAYAKIELGGNGQAIIKETFLHTPDKYYNRKEYNTDKFLKFFDDSTFLYGFQTFDSVYSGSFTTGVAFARSDFNPAARYRTFRYKKVMDRAYVRWYVNTNETNLSMFVTNKRAVIIKQLMRKNLQDSIHYEYYVLNRDLQVLYHAPFSHSFNYRLCFPFKKGFIAIDPLIKKGYYYEIPG